MHYSINLSPERDTLAARDLPTVVSLWLEHIGRTSSPLTAHSCEWQIGRALRWLETAGPASKWEIGRDELLGLADWLVARGYSWHTQNDALRRLRSCLHWAHERGYIPMDCSPWVPTPQGDPPPMRRKARLDDLARLLEVAADGRTGERDHALIALLLGTGLRRAECAALNVEDVQLDADRSGTVAVHHAKRVSGRLIQARMIALDQWTGDRLLPWLERRPQTGPLWVRQEWDATRMWWGDQRLTPIRIGRIVQRAASDAGLSSVIRGPHDLRRAFASHFAAQHRDNALAARILSRQLGHSRFTMTDRYILDDVEDIREVITSPLAGTGAP